MNEDTKILESVDNPIITNPLSDITRHERRFLLISSLAAVALTKGGLVPTKIEPLGIFLGQQEIYVLINLLAIVIVYLSIGFVVYAAGDLKRWNVAIEIGRTCIYPEINKIQEIIRASGWADQVLADPKLGLQLKHVKCASAVIQVSPWRLCFDFYLPILFGFAALVIIWQEANYSLWLLILCLVTLGIAAHLFALLPWIKAICYKFQEVRLNKINSELEIEGARENISKYHRLSKNKMAIAIWLMRRITWKQ